MIVNNSSLDDVKAAVASQRARRVEMTLFAWRWKAATPGSGGPKALLALEPLADDAKPRDEAAEWLDRIERSVRNDGMAKYGEPCNIIRKRYRYEGSAFER